MSILVKYGVNESIIYLGHRGFFLNFLLSFALIYKIVVLDNKHETTGFVIALSNLNALTIPNISIGTNKVITSHAIIDENINQLF
tara:strand:- start:301 stop:555 length:255 start_codon:yes stop_codon:yes gene_type:complete